jgi:hypothetical protein
MSIKTTRTIKRQQAIDILLKEIPELPNDVLADFLDVLADSGQSKVTSKFDNFIVSEFAETE